MDTAFHSFYYRKETIVGITLIKYHSYKATQNIEQFLSFMEYLVIKFYETCKFWQEMDIVCQPYRAIFNVIKNNVFSSKPIFKEVLS